MFLPLKSVIQAAITEYIHIKATPSKGSHWSVQNGTRTKEIHPELRELYAYVEGWMHMLSHTPKRVKMCYIR